MKFKIFSLLLIPLALLSACSPNTSLPQETQQTMKLTPQDTRYKNQPGDDPQLLPPREGDRIAIIETDMGTIKMRLFTNDVPELSKNFMTLARNGKYNDVPFHRVVKNFMIQTGDFTNKDGTGGHSYKGSQEFLPNEINPAYHHLYGTVSMAKTDEPVSIGSQFFIVTNREGTPFLDGNYSPFGQVYEGMDVAEAIADLQVPGTEKPSKVVNIKKVTLSLYTEEDSKTQTQE